MKLRLLTKKDIKYAGAIVRENYSAKDARLAMKEMEDMFTKGSSINPVYIVAEDKGGIVGFAGYMQSWIDYAVYQVFWVNVTPKKQNKGIGKMLIGRIIKEIKKDKKAKVIILSTSSPDYYKKHFKFKSIDLFEGDNYAHHIMSLKV